MVLESILKTLGTVFATLRIILVILGSPERFNFGALLGALFGVISGSTLAIVRVVRRPQKEIIVES